MERLTLWRASVRHRDYAESMNWPRRTVYTTSDINFVAQDVKKATNRIHAILRRNQRKYGSPTVNSVERIGEVFC